MNIGVICGSQRADSESIRISEYLCSRIPVLFNNEETNVEIIDLHEKKIPFWDGGTDIDQNEFIKIWHPVSDALISSDAFIVVTPEWNGMVPPILKNFFLITKPNEIGHKPCLIVSISSGFLGGSYPVAELRMSSYKNNKICYIPEQIIIKNVNDLFHNETKNHFELELSERIDFCLQILSLYAISFRSIRKHKDIVFDERFTYGM